ncbi:MAG TPA: hypothetical protein VK206_13285 [Anaerolineales bacterium]|nr:hypothetical protein [Anaerolineales bacterium]
MGIKNSIGYERGVFAPRAALGRGVPELDDGPGRTPSAHCSGGGPGLDHIGAAHSGQHHNMVRLRSDGRCGGGPTLLFLVWGAALAVAALGYYYWRRGLCSACGRGASAKVGKPSSSYQTRSPSESI